MGAFRVSTVVLILAALSLASGLYLCRSSPSAVAQREQQQRLAQVGSAPQAGGPDRPALRVATRTVERVPFELEAQLSAVLGPLRSVRLAAEVSGRVVEVAVEEHTAVEAGALLVQIERSLLQAAADRFAAAARRARADYELAKLEFQRQQGLKERNVASEAEFDRAQATERARFADLKQAEASLADARVRLEKSAIRAPFAGVVNQLDLEPGAYLQPGQFVAEILDLQEIEIEVGVSDRQVVAIREAQPVSVTVDVFPDEAFTGEVWKVGRSADSQTQKYPVEVRVPNGDGRLLPGMLGQVHFDLGQGPPAIRIPRSASQREYEIDYVFVLDGDPAAPTLERRRVTARPVPFRPDLLEVVTGLREGERIATSKVRQLRDGLRVSVEESEG